MSIQSSHDLKGLQTHKEKLIAEQRIKIDEFNRVNSELNSVRGQIKFVDDRIKTLQQEAKEPIVTEHALLRYIERVAGVDLDKIRQEILNGRTETIKKLKNCKLPLHGNFKIVVKDCCVVSITDRS